MQYNSWLYLFPFLGGSIILYYLIPVKCRWIGLLFSSLLFYILAMKNLVAVVLFILVQELSSSSTKHLN